MAPTGSAIAADDSSVGGGSDGNWLGPRPTPGALCLLAGGATGGLDGRAATALFRFPADVAFAADGRCYVADAVNDRIRVIAPDGTVATLAGSSYGYGDGRGTAARFRRPSALAVAADGRCYVADTGNHAIRRVDADGTVTTLAGSPLGGDRDGCGRDVGLRWPTGLAIGPDGAIVVADHGNGAVKRIEASGRCTTLCRLDAGRLPTAVTHKAGGTVIVAGVARAGGHATEAFLLAVSNR